MRQRYPPGPGSLAHDPRVLVLDEPLNGLDPLARAEMIALFRAAAAQGCYLIITSHILHEVDVISDQVILLSNGYVVADSQIQSLRGEIRTIPRRSSFAATGRRNSPPKPWVQADHRGVDSHDERGVLVKTRDADGLYLMLNQIAVNGIEIDSVAPADDDVNSVYEYLIGNDEVGQ